MDFEMEKVYNPQAIEDKLYQMWEESGAFVAHRVEGKKPFTIVMPPPNITGQLHMGHAMDCLLQDAPIRYHRMKGDPTLWLPGTLSRESTFSQSTAIASFPGKPETKKAARVQRTEQLRGTTLLRGPTGRLNAL